MESYQESVLHVDRQKWIEAVQKLKDEYNIHVGRKPDGVSARRIAILIGELYLRGLDGGNRGSLLIVPMVEKDCYDLAMELHLSCDTLERERRVGPKLAKKVLCTWGVDKKSGAEGHSTILKEWTAQALLGQAKNEKKEEVDGTGGEINIGEGASDVFGFEQIGIG